MKREKHNHASAHARTHARTHMRACTHKNSFNKLTTTREKLKFKINFVTWH